MIDHLATATATIAASADRVWTAMTDPDLVEQWMLGARVASEWRVGSRVTWSGEYEGRQYQDHGTILAAVPASVLRFTHFSPLSGRQDIPENYHTVTWTLEPDGGSTTVRLTQDNNDSEDAAAHSAKNWQSMLEGLRRVAEAG
jgi:uncharacterized protein YndB with AHSA1/START domain